MKQIKIGLAEDQAIVREGLIELLKADAAIEVVFGAANGREVLNQLASTKCDVVVMDIEMPVMSGVEALERIVEDYPKVKVILLSTYFIKPYVVKYIGMGASAYLPKDCGIKKLLLTIHEVAANGFYYDEDVKRMLSTDREPPLAPSGAEAETFKFSATELTVLKLLCEGQTSKEIATALNLSSRTIDWYKDKIEKQTGCANSTQLIHFAIQHKLVAQ